MPILRDFSRSAKWDSVAKELSAGMRQNKKTDAEWCPPPITKQRPLWSLFCYVWRQDENPREWVRKSHAHFARLQSQCKMGQRSEGTERRNEAKQENRCRMLPFSQIPERNLGKRTAERTEERTNGLRCP